MISIRIILVLTILLTTPFACAKESSVKNESYFEDLAFLQEKIEKNFSYYQISSVDLEKEIGSIKSKIKNQKDYSDEDFKIDVQKLISKFIDGHAGVRKWLKKPSNFLPFFIETEIKKGKVRYLAIPENRKNYFNPDFPYIEKIDGIRIDEYIKKLSTYIPKGTRNFVITSGIRLLRAYPSVYKLLNQKELKRSKIDVVFSNDSGKEIKKTIDLTKDHPSYGKWPRESFHKIPKNIGYLQIDEMTDDAKDISRFHKFMKEFKNSKGIILDMRRNGGGRRDLLNELLPYFFKEDQKRFIGAIGYCRLFIGCEIGSRYLYTIHSKLFNNDDKNFLKSFESIFSPKASFNKDLFSHPHFMLIKPDPKKHFNYKGKVFVIMDKWNFSAADIFLSAAKRLHNVTLIGEPSAGGSAARMRYKLPHSRIRVSLARMISLQTNGSLFDGVGIDPHVERNYEKSYYIGKSDDVLKYAIDQLSK